MFLLRKDREFTKNPEYRMVNTRDDFGPSGCGWNDQDFNFRIHLSNSTFTYTLELTRHEANQLHDALDSIPPAIII